MSRPGGKFVGRLVPVLESADLSAAHELLTGLSGDELVEARTWFEKSKRWVRDLDQHVTVDPTAVGDGDSRWSAYYNARWIVAMCAVTLCGPRTAATRIDWATLSSTGNSGEAALVHLLWEQDAAWVVEFADAASRVRLGGRTRSGNATLSGVLRAAVVHHGLPAPSGDAFLKQWRAGTPSTGSRAWEIAQASLAAWLSDDPLMPEVLWLYLASGHCGDDEADLPAAATALERSGAVDRAELVETVLVALTAGQPPVAQRTLGKILAGIGLRADEVRGGLTYLLGVLATSDRSVLPVLLPLAVELVCDGDDLRALVDVIASRPEKRARDLVLSALRTQEVRGRAGDAALADALDVLAGTDDAAYVAKVVALQSKLGLGTGRLAVPDKPRGLWELTMTSAGSDELLWSVHDLWRWAIDTHQIDRHAGGLAVAVEELFLVGGLRVGWDAALTYAESCVAAEQRPTGLVELLRVLARYASEVPGRRGAPPAISALAAQSSTSKVSAEARLLVARLTGEDEGTVVARLRAASPPPAPLERRGLWERMTDETSALPEDLPVHRLAADPLTELGRLAPVHWPSVWGGQSAPGDLGLVDSEMLLDAILGGVHTSGVHAVQSLLVDVDRDHRGPDEIMGAVECWLDDALDATSFWRLATARVASEVQVGTAWRTGARVHDRRAWLEGLPLFSQRLRLPDDPEAGVLVVPNDLSTPAARFLFLRAAEALLRAQDSPVLLGLPTWCDGTLDLDDLLVRLRAASDSGGVVGPIDLVVALHRLRAVHPSRADEVPTGLVTDPRFTDPGGASSLDATALVQTWIRAGGLPELVPVTLDGGWTGAPPTPVPYASLAAWPAELASDPWSPVVAEHDGHSMFRMTEVLRLHPRWSDRALSWAHPGYWWGSIPSLASGPLGLAVHDALLLRLTPAGDMNGRTQPSQFMQQVRRGRIDPATAAAAAVGRHASGTLGLIGMSQTFRTEMERHLRGLWPVALAIADALCGVSRRPAALADLLRVLTSYAHEVPVAASPHAPPGIAALAASKGATKAHLAARDLVAALERRTGGSSIW